MGKKILITGGTGFIGRVLLKYLLDENDFDRIDVVDNLSNSEQYPDEMLFDSRRVFFHNRPVSSYWDLNKGLDEIYHLASPVGPVGVLKHAGTMGPMIVKDTEQLAKMALSNNAKLIDISTSEVYGTDPEGVPQVEDLPKVVPANITVRLEYGVAKLLCEIFLTNMVRTTKLKCNIIRPYNIISYGQQARAGFVLPRFLAQAQKGETLTLYPPGTQRRTFTDVRDFVEAMMLIMKEGVNGEIYNIGNPENLHSIKEFAEAIVAATGSESKIELVDPKELHGKLFEEAWEKIPDITKIQKDLGWTPTRNLDEIIRHAVEQSK